MTSASEPYRLPGRGSRRLAAALLAAALIAGCTAAGRPDGTPAAGAAGQTEGGEADGYASIQGQDGGGAGGQGAGEVGPAAEPVAGPVAGPVFGTGADLLPAGTVRITTASGRTVDVLVRIAATEPARRQGLQNVPIVPDGTGMLFIFPETEDNGRFWMKDTLVPLDILFAADGTITHADTMSPCQQADCPLYGPEGPYDMALETPAGWAGKHRIRPGDLLTVMQHQLG